jgi:two-component system chemotaxis response regulator CheY
MKILVIEDENISLARMVKILTQWGVCDGARTADEAFGLFKKSFDEGSPYDLVTFDIEMPDGNGLDLLDTFRNYEDSLDLDGWNSKKIIISAQSNMENVQKALKNKCDAFLVKPVKYKLLGEKLAQIWH